MLLGPEVVAEMRMVDDTYQAMSKDLTLEDWLARSPSLGVHRQRNEADRSPAVTLQLPTDETSPGQQVDLTSLINVCTSVAKVDNAEPAAARVAVDGSVFAVSTLVSRAA